MEFLRFSIAVACLMTCTSCSNENEQVSTDGINHSHICTLYVSDSIGVELGDSNYVFGAIREVARGPNEEIYVLDYVRCTILEYTSDGEFITQFGRRGSGPGEMLSPGFFEVLGNGLICVGDDNGWLVFDSTGSFTSLQMLAGFGIQWMTPVGTSDIVGIQSELDGDENSFYTTKHICRWSYLEPDSVTVEYFSKQFTIDRNNFTEDLVRVDMFPMLFAAGDGFVFVAPDPQNEPLVLRFEEDGTLLDSIVLPYPEVPRTTEEIEEEKQFIEELFYQNTFGSFEVDWQPSSLRPMITYLGVDHLNRLWVQRGIERYPCFDVFDSNGEHQLTAVLNRDDTCDWQFHVSQHGILAIPLNPANYHVVYMISGMDSD